MIRRRVALTYEQSRHISRKCVIHLSDISGVLGSENQGRPKHSPWTRRWEWCTHLLHKPARQHLEERHDHLMYSTDSHHNQLWTEYEHTFDIKLELARDIIHKLLRGNVVERESKLLCDGVLKTKRELGANHTLVHRRRVEDKPDCLR